MTQLFPTSPVTDLSGVGPKIAQALDKLGITTVGQLVEYLPRRLEDRSITRRINELRPEEEVVVEATVTAVSSRKSKRGVLIIQANCEDETGKIALLWFNQRYLLRYLQPGQQLKVYGCKKIAPSLGNPFFVKTIVERAEVVPIYRSSKNLSQAMFRKLLRQAVQSIISLPTLLPDGPNKKGVLQRCHNNPSERNVAEAQRLLAEEELLLLGVALQQNNQHLPSSEPIKIDEAFLRSLVDELPYQLTDGQRKATWEIMTDLTSSTPMRRLLYGEVGSGKTIIALLVASAIIRTKKKVAILVPTTALAEQQARVAKAILEPIGMKIALVTSDRKDNHTDADLIIGTQALLQKALIMPEVSLVIIDEQQRLGVRERQQLIEQNPTAHLLMMTATPIPRSLAHIIFDQMKLTYLRGKPEHQKQVETIIFNETDRVKTEQEIERRVTAGEPGYVICPLIESSDDEIVEDLFTAERRTINKEVKRLKERFPSFSIALLHGRLSATEKTKILTDFRSSNIDILVSTTVVEVGIDNPNATWILIEEADCFGLSSLHQLRGRVGRGDKASVCFLAKRASITPLGEQRLEAISQTTDGLELAEADLRLRGPGELVGVEQSGLPRLRYANWQDLDLVKTTFAKAKEIVQDGIDRYPTLQEALEQMDTTQIS